MPTMVDATGHRKVRCPKCTAVLTEPQTQIYECPICRTLLLAKGNPGSKLWENRAYKSDGDADDIQQTLEGGSKLEKATLMNESSNVQAQQSIVDVSNVGFDGRSRASQQGHVPLDSDNQSLSGNTFSKVKTEPVNDLAPINIALAPDTPPDTPHPQKSPHVGEISVRGGSGQQLYELDSASHSESEVDSSIWSSENANIGEVTEFSSVVSGSEASGLIAGSSEHVTISKPNLSSGAASNNGTRSFQEESELQIRRPSDARSLAKRAEEETECEVVQLPPEFTHEERKYLESQVRNPDIPVITSSNKSTPEEGRKAKDKTDDDSSSSSPQRNLVDSTPKERVSTDSKQQKDVEISKIGKFGLFDLSVFGIYSEDAYSELRRGKAAHYSKLSGSSSDCEDVRSTVDGDLKSHSREVAPQSFSCELGHAGNYTVDNIAEVQKISDIPESINDGIANETGSFVEVHIENQEQDTDARNSGSVGQEVDDNGNVSVGDVGLLPNSSVDSDAVANARYGDNLAERDLSAEMGSSVDISFGDWRQQQVVKLPQTFVDAGPIYERGMSDVVARDSSDSSWDNEEDLTFTSTLQESSKLKVTTGTDKEDQASRTNIGKTVLKNPALPFRTTAMQKFLQRNEQEGIVQTHSQESIKGESELYEASYVEHYTPGLENNGFEALDQGTIPTPESNVDDTLHTKEDKPQMVPVQEGLVCIETKVMERQHENQSSVHSTPISNVDNAAVPPTQLSGEEGDVQDAQFRRDRATSEDLVSPRPLSRKENDVQITVAEDPQSRQGFNEFKSPQRDVGVNEADRPGVEARDLKLLNVDHFKHGHANKEGSAPGKPASLKWKGKGRSSTQSLSSTEDDGAYGMESEAGSGPDGDYTKNQGVGLTERQFLPDKETQPGLSQPTRGHYQPTQRSWLSNADVDRQKHGSGEITGSRRSARSRAANARLSSRESFEQVDAGSISNLETFGRSSLGLLENVPALQSSAVKLNRSMLDHGSNYSYHSTADYNSDHSSRSQDAPYRPRYNETYMSNPYGLPAAGSTQAYPSSSHGSVPQTPLQEPGFTHSAHHCVSPTCSLCMQQQYNMQPQMIQNVMMHPCAACASQSSAAGYHQHLHHGAHSHHMHGLTYSNRPLRQHNSGSLPLPGHSQMQNGSNIHQSRLLPLTRRAKLYPPLPGKDAPPYVLCKHCNQLLQVPGYFPRINEPIQKLQCGSCEKISKFSVCLQTVNPLADRNLWETSGGLDMHASGNHLARDKRRKDTTSIHSSDQIYSSGLANPAQNSYGRVWHTSGLGSQQEWAENQMYLQSSASGTPQTETSGSRHHARPMAGGASERYRSYGRRVEGEHLHNNVGAFSEGYLSSTSSSPSGSSPGRPPQISQQHQRVEAMRQRTTMHQQGRPLFEAPSFSDDFFQKGPTENRSRHSSTSLQGSVHDSYSDSPRNENLDRLQLASKAGSWHNQPADVEYSGRSAVRSHIEHLRKPPAAPGSPLIEHFTQEADDVNPTLQPRHMLQNFGNGSRSAPWSPGSGSPRSSLVDSSTQDASTDTGGKPLERERPAQPAQDASKGSKIAGLFKRSMRGAQAGNIQRKVVVNGHLITEAAVQKAEELAGPIHSGSYWYDYQAGFWGAMGGPCLGILMPFIEEFHFPLARHCAGGTTGILVNGRELHEKDLKVLVKRGMPTKSGKAYILDINGALFDDGTGQPLKGLGKLAPSMLKKGRGFGMSQFPAQS